MKTELNSETFKKKKEIQIHIYYFPFRRLYQFFANFDYERESH